MKLWNKDGNSNNKVDNFTVGEDRKNDLEIAKYDCIASISHAKMLNKIGIINAQELKKIKSVLNKIKDDAEKGSLEIENEFEDIHSKIEFILVDKLGEIGKKIHTGRSRNDQVLVAMHLFLIDSLNDIKSLVVSLFDVLMKLSNSHKDKLMPGYTHLQVAMPSSFGLWFSAYAESLIDDIIFINSAIKVLDQNPLGSAAGFGSSFNIDRNFTTKDLGFKFLKINSISAQMNRGKIEKSTSICLSMIASTISKLSMDICLYMGQDYNFISFPKDLTTGSSIMPHKKNPDIFEIIRGKSNLIQSLPNQFIILTSNLPSGYHREFQLTKGPIISGIKELKSCIRMMIDALPKIIVSDKIINQDKYKYVYTVDTINNKVQKGESFRNAYKTLIDEIESDKYKKPKSVNYSHIGSIGNLSLELIKEKLKHFLKV
ncbi:MAG: argininosuccinate lyase [Flavobacteriaceae bacterium]|tara:strand:- start:67 stop:1353 length:1287 start_codon:yes stop_codon:yes gene_type:complete